MFFVVQAVLVLTLQAILTLILVRGQGQQSPSYPSPSWFSLNNSKRIKAVTLEFFRIQ